MSDKQENSVLFSLRELRTIEEERIQEEDDADRLAEDERVRAQQLAARRKLEEADGKRRAAEQAEQAERERQEHLARDERMRLEEAERKARMDAQTHLEAERLRHEMEIRQVEVSKKFPMWLRFLTGGLVIVAIAVGVFAMNKKSEHDADKARAAAIAEQAKKDKAQFEAKIGDFNKRIAQARGEEMERYEELLAATTDTEKNARKVTLEQAKEKLAKVKEEKDGVIRAEKKRTAKIKAATGE